MNRQRFEVWTGAILGMVCALLLSGYAHGSDFHGKVSEEFHHTYPLSAGGRVDLDNINGDVKITAWDRDEVKVDAVKYAHSKDTLADVDIDVNADSSSVSIQTRYRSHDHYFGSGDHDSASVDYTLMVPRNARLDEIKLVNGPLEIHGVAGEVHASTVNGQLLADGLQGRVEISTVNGHSEVRFERVSDSIDLSSVNGSVKLVIPSDTKARLDVSTVSGSIDNDFGFRANRHSWVGHSMAGDLGGGGPDIKLSNVNGHIELRHADDGKPLSPVNDRSRSNDDGDEI
ncbi:MAG TPA: DUF4097 family beta strand repeat-containing protein [Terriglobales bacterium]